MSRQQHVFIVGSKGIPAQYGGYETFVEQLTLQQQNKSVKYHVACKTGEKHVERFEYHGADCFSIYVPNIGSAQAIYYDVAAIKESIRYIKKNRIESPLLYILACRIGPFMHHYVNQFHALGGKVYVNPDGHEWLRAKWSKPVREYWRFSERLMVKHADLLICDSIHIEQYIQKTYAKYRPKTTFIAYGADVVDNPCKESVAPWFQEKGVTPNDYYLIVGRFVPENNYETMIREFMASDSTKDLVIVTNVEQNKFYEKLCEKTHFDKDHRIKFVGTVYDTSLLFEIRKLAFAYIHGHSVGGTNPSLLEALATTGLNLLFDVGFNREVAGRAAMYWNQNNGSLKKTIHAAEQLSMDELHNFDVESSRIIRKKYSWYSIIKKYEQQFLTEA